MPVSMGEVAARNSYNTLTRRVMITKLTTNVRCDIRDCKNIATHAINVKGRAQRLYLCELCLSKIAQASKPTPPRSPKNTIKRKQEQGQEMLATKE